MRALISCEESQTVCKAFRKLGHEAYSCDILPCSGGFPEWHIQDDVLKHLDEGWDLMIGHPPCQFLSYAANHVWNAPGRAKLREEAMEFFLKLYNADIPKICIENPVGYPNTVFRKPDQILQPYYFGDPAIKRTCLWLKNLPKLDYSKTIIEKPEPIYISKSGKPLHFTEAQSGFHKDAAKLRSKFWPKFAEQMAIQWS